MSNGKETVGNIKGSFEFLVTESLCCGFAEWVGGQLRKHQRSLLLFLLSG